MEKRVARAIALVVIAALCLTFLPNIAEAKEGNRFIEGLKKILVYPFRVTKESTEVVTDTATEGAETVVETGKAAAGVVTGDVQKFDDLVVEPVKGSVETSVTAIEGTVKMPIEAATEQESIE